MTTGPFSDTVALKVCAQTMADMLHSDSHISQKESLPVIFEALRKDGHIPTLYEMECLTLGGPLNAEINEDQPETDGEGSETVDALFPRTVLAIGSLF